MGTPIKAGGKLAAHKTTMDPWREPMDHSLSTHRINQAATALFALAVCVALATNAQAKTQLLAFSSPHCGPCQQLKPTLQQMQRAGYPIQPVDVTQQPQVAQQFRVSRVPCLVMVTDGREVNRIPHGASAAELQQMFAAAGFDLRQQQAQAAASQAANAQPANRSARPAWLNETQAPVLDSTPPVASQQAPPAKASATPDAFARELLESTVRITLSDETGQSFGTGTIIDTREGDALVLTCGHLFRESERQPQVLIEIYRYQADGLQVVEKVAGTVESFDLERDVALVSMHPKQQVKVVPVAANFGERVNDRVWSVGCDLGADPTVRDSRVTDIDRYHGPPNIETSGAPIQGRSGGGLFNSRGEVIGVCFAADVEGDEGLYSGLASVHAELDGLGLQAIYNPRAAALAQASPAETQSQPNPSVARLAPLPSVDRIVRGQSPAAEQSSFPSPPAPSQLTPPSGSPSRLVPAEQAALSEIASRAAESEVVVIVRPREPGGASEVLKLDRVSPEFVQALRQMPR